MSPTEQDIVNLRTALKRCSADTIDAAIRYRTMGDADAVPAIVYGIIERHLAPENSRPLAQAGDQTQLVEDLGIDSLTLLEIVLSIEETLNITIENEELREIRTLGEVKYFITRKISGGGPEAAAESKTRRFSREDIMARLPQQPPFLFLDDAELEGNVVRARYTIKGDEFFLEGHFKDNPVMPASIVFEAVGQAACLWVLENAPDQLHVALKSNEVLFASMEEAHFYRRAKPGDMLEMEAEMLRLRAPLAVFKGNVKLHGERLAQIEHLVLAFGQEVVEHLEKREKEEETKDEAALPVQVSVSPLPAQPAVSPAKAGKAATPVKTGTP
jgi:acyl carrier protein